MRFTALNTDRPRRLQSGQAIVLIALMMIVLIGFLGLAIDGGRAYIDRRELQDAVDAAVLAAGDNYELQGDTVQAAAQAAKLYALNEHIANYNGYASGATACPAAFPAGSTCSLYTWGGYPGSFTFGYLVNRFNGTIFSGSATHQLAVTFMQVLGVPAINNFTAIAEAVVGDQWQTPALLTLGQNGCNGNNGDSLTIQGSVTVAVTGDVYSNGDLKDQNGSPVSVDGSVYAQCGALPGGWTYTGSLKVPGAPVLADPGYTSPYATSLFNYYTSTYPAGSSVELKPGVYANDPKFTSTVCHFLDPGIYSFPGGYTNNGGIVSNELRPPAEPLWDTSLSPAGINWSKYAGVQFWSQNSTGCAGDFYANAVVSTGGGGKPLKPAGQWGVEITAVREDTWTGPSGNGTYLRQSAPSMCHTLQQPMDGSTKGFQVVIGNVPGATGYYVYANPNGCDQNQGNFGFAGYVPVSSGVYASEQGNTGGCGNQNQLPGYPNSPPAPGAGNVAVSGASYSGCGLGWVSSQIFDNNSSNSTGYLAFNTNGNTTWGSAGGQCPAAQYNNPGPSTTLPSQGCDPPDGELAPPGPGTSNASPDRGVTPTGDRADENQCRPQGTTTNPCAGSIVTPGAVQFYFPPNACFNQEGNGGAIVYSGYQYNWIVLFAPGNTSPPTPPTPNSCSGNNLSGNSATQFIGSIYMPAGSITINGSSAKAPVAGQVICYNALIDGSSGVAIAYDPDVAPAPPAARLIL
jgi:Flp pilus assembly protein TadG